ncbi:MAG: hypothetical protein LAO51_09175 [Acidobacteriia bacterium]|nr:hypothetical protein [Terriglobia bacterium]
MTRPRRTPALIVAIFVVTLLSKAAETAPVRDPEGAARQYRIARRLVAEGSADAAAALAKVFDLDPAGPLADDALVEQALLLPVATWPGDLGRIAAPEALRAAALLDRAIDGFPGGDRASEARVLRAFLRLEPLLGRDPARARLDLLGVATGAVDERWRSSARFGIAWIDERSGERERARSAYQRLAIDGATTPAGDRSRARLARMLLRDGKPGRAAALIEENAEEGGERETLALRDLAVRSTLRQAGVGGRWTGGTAVTAPSGLKGVAAAARLRDGGLLLADRRTGAVIEIEADGKTGARFALDGVQALTEDSMGRRFAAAGERLYRLLPSGPVAVAELGAFSPASAMTADGWGRLYLLDRHGERIGVLEPGAPSPAALAGVAKAPRLTGLVWDGARLVSLDARAKGLVEVLADGSLRPIAAVPCERPEALAADPAGEVAVLDSKADEVLLLGPDGQVRDRVSIRAAGLPRADTIVLGADGSLDLQAEGGGTTARFP